MAAEEQLKRALELARRLRTTRANMLGTNDEDHYWTCHDAADELISLVELITIARKIQARTTNSAQISSSAVEAEKALYLQHTPKVHATSHECTLPIGYAVLLADGSVYGIYRSENDANAINELVTGGHGVIPLFPKTTKDNTDV